VYKDYDAAFKFLLEVGINAKVPVLEQLQARGVQFCK